MDKRLPTLGLMALLAGCVPDKGQQEPMSRTEQVAQAQQRSQQALERAREAQEQATRQQREAQKAREQMAKKEQELAKKQAEARRAEQELAQARQRAEQERQQAIQAQQQATQEMQRAQEIAAQAQQRALALQRNRVTVSGEVAAVREDEIVIHDPGARQPLRLAVQENTVVLKDGEPASLRELPLGTDVRATYQFIGGEHVATQLEVSTPEQPQQEQRQ
jgi:colicin import membrane protein